METQSPDALRAIAMAAAELRCLAKHLSVGARDVTWDAATTDDGRTLVFVSDVKRDADCMILEALPDGQWTVQEDPGLAPDTYPTLNAAACSACPSERCTRRANR